MKSMRLSTLNVLGKTMTLLAVMLFTGCAAIQSQLEVPSLENQINRVVSGLDAVRTNEVISAMTISSDAKWPAALNEDISDESKSIIDQVLESDPYIGTHVYTDASQQEVLGGVVTPKVGSLVYDVVNRFLVLYGIEEKETHSEWPKHWPSAFVLGSNMASYNVFEDKGRPKRVTAIKGNSYKGYAAAVIALMPSNFQKDLGQFKKSMDESIGDVVGLKAKIGELETRLKSDGENSVLTEADIYAINNEISTLEADLASKEAIYDEHEEIYLTKLDEAVEVLKSDMNLSEEQIDLARNISLTSSAIRSGALDAGQAFTLALLNLTTKDIIQNFPNELLSLNQGKRYVPYDKLDLFEQRTSRLAENGLFALPAIGVGSYYAVKQAILAGKYQDIAQVILDADQARKEAEMAMAQASQ